MSFILTPTYFLRFSLTWILVLIFGSCTEEAQIESYYIKPEYNGPVVAWKLPDHWGENPDLSGPMAGSFHVKTKDGPSGRIGVMPFRQAVSTLDIANMFGMELGHSKFDENTLKKFTTVQKIANEEFEWIRLAKQDGSLNPNTALLAILKKDEETWLFPFVADAQLIDQEINTFEDFLGSITVRGGEQEIRAIQPVLPPSAKNSTQNSPTWEAPEHWKKGKSSAMRVGSYRVDGNDGESLDFSISTFPGDVGGLLPNINRWLQQVDLPEIETSSLSQYVSPIKLDGKDAHLLIADNEEKSVYGVLFFGKSNSWFFKLIGDSKLAKVEKENFMNLITSVCFHDH